MSIYGGCHDYLPSAIFLEDPAVCGVLAKNKFTLELCALKKKKEQMTLSAMLLFFIFYLSLPSLSPPLSTAESISTYLAAAWAV
jgi:hypothetical protein